MSLDPPPSPERRSAADLQRILGSLIGDRPHVLSGSLPEVLLAYEAEHNLVILEPEDYSTLRDLCNDHPDLELGAKDLFNFLSMVPQHKPKRNNNPGMPHSSSMPPSSFRELQTTPSSRPSRTSRRHSDRIRSPSDSSSSGSEDEDKTQRFRRQSSAPPGDVDAAVPFPGSGGGEPSTPRLFGLRGKTLSDPESSLDSPLPTRIKGRAPPSAFSSFGAFARPSPASRRRRSSGAKSEQGEDEDKIPQYGRSASATLVSTSPAWSQNSSRVSVPTSPTGVDETSFHRAKSPESDIVDVMIATDQTEDVLEDQEAEHVENGMLTVDQRLSRLSTSSSNSLRTSHDKLEELQKQNVELGRKLKESERQLAVLGAENERLVEDLQDKLEEARAELAQKRKDEKELKSKDRAQLIQIAGFEADIQSLQRSLENSKNNHVNMQKMYNSQCDEAQRLRDILRDRDEEIQAMETAARGHEADEEKTTREVQVLEAEVKRLEQDLSLARQAESHLETQKQENLALRETIDRMRFELDEAKANATITGGHTRNPTGSSGPATLSRNLGDELHRRLQEAEKLHEEDEEDSVIETIVTRTRKVGGRKQGDSAPVLRVEEGVREYADASTETDPIPAVAGPSSEPLPPAYSADPEPVNAQQIIDQAHPRGMVHDVLGEAYEAVVEDVGTRCTVLEAELKQLNVRRNKSGRASKGRSFADQRQDRQSGSIVNYIMYHASDTTSFAGKVAACAVTAFAVGIIFGAHFYSVPGGIHPRDYALFNQMNTIALATGAGEGFLPKGMLGVVETGARIVAGRVPS